MTRTLITGATVLTMDDELGMLPRGDVLIDGPRIAAVGADLPREPGVEVVDGADRIVMPGFVDTHRHMWAAMLRGCACYGDLGTYFHDVVFTYGANFTPEDTYTSVRFGLAEAIDSGITTMHAWEHNIQTPAPRRRGAAGARGVRAAGALLLRAVERPGGRQLVRPGHASRSTSTTCCACAASASATRTAAPAPRHRLPRRRLLAAGDLAAGVRVRPRARAADHDAHDDDRPTTSSGSGRSASTRSTRRSAPTSCSSTRSTPTRTSGATSRATGTPVSLSILSELRVGMGIPPIVEMMQAGVPLCLSVDTMAASDNSDFFAVLRATLAIAARRPPGREGLPARPGAAPRHDRRRPRPRPRRRHRLADARQARRRHRPAGRRPQPRADQRRRRPGRARRPAAQRRARVDRRRRPQARRRARRRRSPRSSSAAPRTPSPGSARGSAGR